MSFNSDLPECIGAVFDCDSQAPTCRDSAGFGFATLWNITLQYSEQCPHGPWLFQQAGSIVPVSDDHLALTRDACEIIAGPSWTKYPGGDIWNRLTTWKFTLFQLVAISPRPPLGIWVESFSFSHLLGDPIGTITDIIRKIENCQDRAVFWQDCLKVELVSVNDKCEEMKRSQAWKSLAIIVDSFDEWGLSVGDQAQDYLLAELNRLSSRNADFTNLEKYLSICFRTADALAADRTTKFFPIMIAQAFYIGSVAIAMIRTKSSSEGSNPSTSINIEMYSIAFTAQYFWVIFIVFWTSIIGTSQSAVAIPNILKHFRSDLELSAMTPITNITLPTDKLDSELRIYNGGVYSWQPMRWWTPTTRSPLAKFGNLWNLRHSFPLVQGAVMAFKSPSWSPIRLSIPFIVVAAAAGTGQLISALVPPTGWSCRSGGMMWMFVTWVVSYMLSFVPFNTKYSLQFWMTLAKDLLAIGVTFGIVIGTQLGMYNRCDCYTSWGRVGLQLPSMPAVRDVLQSRLTGLYTAIATVGIAIQLILIPGLLVWRYHAAVQVFLQRDDGTSNLVMWHRLWRWTKGRFCDDNIQRNAIRPPSYVGVDGKDEEACGEAFFEEIELVK